MKKSQLKKLIKESLNNSTYKIIYEDFDGEEIIYNEQTFDSIRDANLWLDQHTNEYYDEDYEGNQILKYWYYNPEIEESFPNAYAEEINNSVPLKENNNFITYQRKKEELVKILNEDNKKIISILKYFAEHYEKHGSTGRLFKSSYKQLEKILEMIENKRLQRVR